MDYKLREIIDVILLVIVIILCSISLIVGCGKVSINEEREPIEELAKYSKYRVKPKDKLEPIPYLPIEEKLITEEETESETQYYEEVYEEVYYEPSYDVNDFSYYEESVEALNPYVGVVYYNGHKETYYSQQVLPGEGLNIPGRYVAEDGTVRDENGYICVAADPSYLEYGSIIETSLGIGKVYDSGCDYGTIDIYTNW